MQKIVPLTPAQFAAFRPEAALAGIILPDGDSGQVVTRGVTMKYDYDGTNLTLTIVDKPWYIPASMIWGELQPYFPAA